MRLTIEAAADGFVTPEVEYRILRSDGTERTLHGRRELVWDGETLIAVRAMVEDITERKELEAERERLFAQVEALARTDALTGLPNRRAWDEELQREVGRAVRRSGRLAVVMLDIDYFKQFNDSEGHQAGDSLLHEAASNWRVALRVTDLIARYGGDEFGVVLPDCSPHYAATVLERLRVATPQGHGSSAGIAYWDGTETSEALVARADRALYAAKQNGRGRSVTADIR